MSGDGGVRRTHVRIPVVGRLVPPFGHNFVAVEATGAVALVGAILVALAWANLAPTAYTSFWDRSLTIGIGGLAVGHTLHDWVSEGLMTIFFFVLGLELKGELVTGDLRRPRAAALPIGAAVGGVILPALIFTAIVRGGAGAGGWAIPMATDAALALGVLTALGRRVAPGAKTLLLAIAIVDDLIAILVIAFVFTGGVDFPPLAGAAAAVGSVFGLRALGVARPLAYVPSGVALWLALGAAGIHPTIAGAMLGLLTPAKPPADAEVLGRIEDRVHPWAALVVVPVFALASVGIAITDDSVAALTRPLALGVAVGLVIGKTVGIYGVGTVLTRLGVAELPPGTGRSDLFGVAVLGGVGLSVALFITDLALEGSAARDATIGLLVGSLVSAALGASVFLVGARRRSRRDAAAPGTMG